MVEESHGTSRRRFLVLSGTALGGTVVLRSAGAAGDPPEVLEGLADRLTDSSGTNLFGWPVVLRRPADQLVLTLRGYNLSIDYTKSPPVLTRVSDQLDSFLAVEFGPPNTPAPMHVAEQAYPLTGGDLPSQGGAPIKAPTSSSAVGAPPVGARIAGLSRLAFELPADRVAPGAAHPFTLESAALLDWVDLLLAVVPNAVPPINPALLPSGVGTPRAPGLGETAIELPYSLVVSPPRRPRAVGLLGEAVVFVNAVEPVTHHGWTELWHTRMAALVQRTSGHLSFLGVDESDRSLRTIRAVWSTDPGFEKDMAANKSDDELADDHRPPFTSALRYVDRYDIVRLSGDFTPDSKGGPYLRGRQVIGNRVVNPGYLPAPATVDRLMLSSLGAWLQADAHLNLPHSTARKHFNSSLLAWRQRTVQARDSYVRVVRKGYLFPWGHLASLVTVTEREFVERKGEVGAYLRQKTFIVVSAPVKDYVGSDSVRDSGRAFPFTSAEAITLVTPDLAKPARYVTAKKGGKHVQGSAELIFEPRTLDGHPFLFHFRGTDWAGDPIDVRSPVLWVDDTVAYADTTARKTLLDDVFAKWRAAYPDIDVRGQRVSMAAPKDPSAATGDTQVVLASFQLGVSPRLAGVSPAHLAASGQPAFFPTLHTAAVRMPEAEAASGHSVGTATMAYESAHYLHAGFAGNPGGVYLRRATGATRRKIAFSAAKGGGSLTPNLHVDGLSREIGPVSGDVDQLAAGTFDPKAVFDGVEAKLLGGLELSTILKQVGFGDDDNAQALQITSVELLQPHRIVTTVDWHPSIQAGGPTIAGQQIEIFVPTGDVDTSMDLHAEIVTDLDHPANSTSTVIGQIRDFELDLFGNSGGEFFIQIPFDSLTFHAQQGRKTQVDVAIGSGGVQFQGALSFVQTLADYLSFDGSGLVIDTSGSAITATLTLAIPTIAVGVFALQNLAFSAGVAIPYNGDPVRFDFAFCSRENPFQLQIMIFTGGGFVGLGIGADGVELLEFSFDFGLGISIDIGIASGQVSLVGGVYFELEKGDDGSQDVDLTAYVKASGGVSCLGIISVSVELYLALEYQSDGTNSQLAGDATMTISVHVLFFGGSVGFSIHEQFAGGGVGAHAVAGNAAGQRALSGLAGAAGPKAASPPPNTFGSSMSEQDWAAYCTSFALIGIGV